MTRNLLSTTINCWLATNRKCSIQVGFDWFDRNTIHWDKNYYGWKQWISQLRVGIKKVGFCWEKELGSASPIWSKGWRDVGQGFIYGTGSCNTSLCVSPQPKCNYSLDITYSKILFISYDLLTTNRICKDFEVAFK